jgi:hypothetical protein
MIRRMVLGIGLVASVALAGAVGAAGTANAVGGTDAAQLAKTAGAQPAPDLTGTWRLDPKRSDSMLQPEGGAMGRGARGGMEGGGMGGPGGMGGRGMGGPGGMGGGRGGRGAPPSGDAERGPRDGGSGAGDGAARPVRLPDLMHVTMTATLVSFEDSTGKVLREVTTLAGAAEDKEAHAPGAQVLSGEWKSDKLEVQRPGRGEVKMTETITLEEKGTLLVIRTAMPAFGDRPAREHKRVYRRRRCPPRPPRPRMRSSASGA